jgi:Ca-activated chloride channel family protein
MRFEHQSLLLLVGVLPALIAFYAWADRKRRQAQERFQSSAATQVHFSRRRWKRACLLAAAISLIVALSKPAWERPGGAPPEDTGDVVFLLDVSRSMLSDDIAPTRLARAKLIIASLVRQFHGERTALVEFAGVPSVECPLTIDEAFFKTMLERASPTSVARGGTHIGDAIQFSLDSVFDDLDRTRKRLVILTDGGDQGSFPAIAAGAALTRGIGIVAMGVGDEQNGALVPTSESDRTPILYHGAKVRTKLEPGVLQGIAKASAGVYLNAGTGQVDTTEIYQQFIASTKPARSHNQETSASSWLVLLAAVLLVFELFLSDRRARAAGVAAILIAELSAQTPVWEIPSEQILNPETQADWIAKGNAEYRESYWGKAVESYRKAVSYTPAWPQAHFNLGMALYRAGQYGSASDAFGNAAVAARGTPLEDTSKFGRANCAFRLAMAAQPSLTRQLLYKVLRDYEELSAIPDAKFNAEVVRRLLSDMQGQQFPNDAPKTPSAKKKASGPQEIVDQGGVQGKPTLQSVDKDW